MRLRSPPISLSTNNYQCNPLTLSIYLKNNWIYQKWYEIRTNYRIASDEASNSIGHFQGVARAGPDDFHLVDIELRLAPLLRQMIHPLHFHRKRNPSNPITMSIENSDFCSLSSEEPMRRIVNVREQSTVYIRKTWDDLLWFLIINSIIVFYFLIYLWSRRIRVSWCPHRCVS